MTTPFQNPEARVIEVLVVEDSFVCRQIIRHVLESDHEMRVIGMAKNGREALDFIKNRRPDVITMDINMPEMNGLETTRRIMEDNPIPIVIVSASINPRDVERSFSAMESGAVAVVGKPVGEDDPGYEEISAQLLQTVKLMSEVKVIKRWGKTENFKNNSMPQAVPEAKKDIKLIAIGASTGGPPVLQTILSGFRATVGAPVLVVQHIAAGFLEGMVEWLRQSSHNPIQIAEHGEFLLPGHIYFAPDDYHIGVNMEKRVELSKKGPVNGVRPSVSYLFRSALEVYGGDMAGVLLTGMGKDGAEELKLLKEKGALTIVQDRETSVVYGMPGEALRIEAAKFVLTPEKIPGVIEGFMK
ncbi:MAG: chemotaxis-specific protein-glutamate methyltransferase CheB [Deltaproteobacteria bacterium]|nr:chemotaxis-specific protein-glutamate methyltransferase CheB [Deltaproteobacteria bacterium]